MAKQDRLQSGRLTQLGCFDLNSQVRLQHYGVSDYWPERRVVERVTIAGGLPVRHQFGGDSHVGGEEEEQGSWGGSPTSRL